MTPFTDVYDKALITISDYKLDELARNDYEAFLLHLEGILVNAIPDFDGCLKSLDYDYLNSVEYISDVEPIEIKVPFFIETLDRKEISILSKLMVINWFTSKIQDVTQFQGSLITREFKKFSEANNLKQKSSYLNELIERFEQEVTDYQLSHIEDLPYFKDF